MFEKCCDASVATRHQTLKFLFEKGADVNEITTYFGIPLHPAASGGLISATRVLVDKGPGLNIKNLQDGRTALHYASLAGQESAVAFLLSGHTGAAELLLAQESGDANAKIQQYDTHLLTHAITRNRVDVVEQLLKRPELDVNIRDPDSDETPLSLAAGCGYDSIVKFLRARPDVDVNKKGQISTPLGIAVEEEEEEVVNLLLASPGVDKNAQTGAGFTPLIRAAGAGHEDVVSVMLEGEKVEVNLGTTEVGWLLSSDVMKRESRLEDIYGKPWTWLKKQMTILERL
ncbi:hypothetical protein FQN54_001577 [Arachnomyces sp. PD_36]|nr:hypothetical protein FQN54_001577 [Arachnomyces sp. PD_36]